MVLFPFTRKGPSGFDFYSTAEEVTAGIDGSRLTAIVTGGPIYKLHLFHPSSISLDMLSFEKAMGAMIPYKEIPRSSNGIGVETARVLALRGVHVVIAVRNLALGYKAQEKILEAARTSKVDVMELDLSSMGAATTCYVALHPDLEGVTGKFFMDSNMTKPGKLACDEQLARKLWNFSLKLIGE